MSNCLFSVEEEVVVVTGVSGQLGFQYAYSFLENGAKVVGTDLAKNKKVLELENKFGNRFLFSPCDVTSSDQLKSTLHKVIEVFGEPSVLVNNAAIDSPPNAPIEETGPFEEYPDDSWDRVMDVNVKGVYLACKVFGSVMAENGVGSIINVSSIYGVVSPDQSIYDFRRKRGEVFYKPVAYSVSKSALLNMTRYLSVYWADKGVRVNTLVIAGVHNNQEKPFMDAYCGRIPIGRMANEDEYNGAVLFLASKASSYMTGAQLTVDGGWTAI